MTRFILRKKGAQYGGAASLALVCASFLFLFYAPLDHAEKEVHSPLDLQRKALAEAVSRGDAVAVARIFTLDAKLMLPGFETIAGREPIQKFWQAGLGSGVVKGI